MPDYRPLRPAASSPAPPHHQIAPSQAAEGPSVRQMRREYSIQVCGILIDILKRTSTVKVLYSFDNENKTNCLARWPNPIDIRTAYLDESNQIGVIELKTCIQAIVAASPELVAKLGQDYTVYAYDYSEYETPLVGQGMLSWVLASSSSTPSAPAHQSRTIVTGRVCKNLLGLFSSTSHETLEVKLRLVPVPTSLQSEYIDSMKKYRDISQIMPEGFDPQAWTNFIQANPNFFQLATHSRSQSPAMSSGQTSGFGIEHIQRLLNGGGLAPRNAEPQPVLPQNINHPSVDAAGPLPRPSSAASSVHSATAPKRRGRPPGAKTAARGRSVRAKKTEIPQAPISSGDPGYVSNDETVDEGSNRKRAKVIQAEWSGRNEFGKQPESLRVAASTAASVRIHQPTAVRPNSSLATSLEGPPREPTPIATASNRMQRPQLPQHRSSLRRESFAEHKPYASPYAPPERPVNTGESALTSPEASQAESSPVDISSSPPVYRGGSAAASSPNLPTLPKHFEDSGFMSGSIDDLFEDDEMRPIDDEDLEMVAQYIKRPELPGAPPGQAVEHQLAVATKPCEPPLQEDGFEAKAAAQKRQMAANARLLSRTTSSGALAPPAIPASDPIRPNSLHRSQTWSGNQAPHPMSDIAPPNLAEEAIQRPMSRNRKGSDGGIGAGAKRKQAIQSKLASSVAAGEMPPFCENCGAIETPTWRKAWIKIHSGTPEHVVISEEEGGIIAWQPLQTDHEGTVCLYRIIKKSILKTDEGFTEILLCNRKFPRETSQLPFTDKITACGLWLHTRKCMRPKEFWEKPQNGGDGKRRRTTNGRKQGPDSGSASTSNYASDGTTLYSDASSPANDTGQTETMEEEPRLPVLKHRRSLSDQHVSPQSKAKVLNEKSALAALQRAIRSSPHKFMGTEQIPIEIEDLTPKPTRRILFPSPSKSHEAGSRPGSTVGSERRGSKQDDCYNRPARGDAHADKENRPPQEEGNQERYEEDPFSNARSRTPSFSSSIRPTAFKTPIRSPGRLLPTTGDFFSSAAKALLRPPTTPKRTPTRDTQPLGELTPFTAHLNQLLSETNNGSPRSQSFDFPSLPSLRNTPGRITRTMDFDFSQFDSQDLVSTDVPMPSSPPVWFGVYEDPLETDNAALWDDHQLTGAGSIPDREGVEAKEPHTSGIDEDGDHRRCIEF